MTSTRESSRRPRRLHLLAAVALLAGPAGCSSMLNTTMLRDALVDAVDSPFDGGPLAGDRDDAAAQPQPSKPSDSAAVAESGHDADDAETRRQQLAETLDSAIERLSRVGGLDDATRGALLSTLESTHPDDWPAVIDAFTASLTAVPPRSEPTPPSDSAVAAQAEPVTPPAAQPEPVEQPAEGGGLIFPVEPVAAAVIEPISPTVTSVPAVSVPGAAANGQPQLAVANACFASRVRAWGDVDRFTADRFRPGQDVIVYFELDNLTASESTAGHTTIIDSSLRLIDEEGRLVHEWNFDPIDETCPARRRDYFARYLVRIPESVPAGSYRVELAVSDVLGGRTVQTSLPLAVGDRMAAGGLQDGVESRR